MHQDRVDSNAVTFKDELSGCEVRRVAMHGVGCVQPYFTNHAFVQGGNSIIYCAEDEEHRVEIYRVDIDGGPATRLTFASQAGLKGPAWSYPCEEYIGVNWASCGLAPRTNRVFYYAGFNVFRLDLASGRTDVIYEIPHDRIAFIPHLSAEEDLIVVPTVDRRIEQVPATPTRQHDTHTFVLKQRLTSDLTLVRSDGSGAKKVFEDNCWITHAQICPTDPNLILYCHEGLWQQVAQRMWLCDVRTGRSRRLRDQRGTGLQIGHELWLADGRRVLYHGWDGKRDDTDTNATAGAFAGRQVWEGNKKDRHALCSLVGIIDVHTGEYVEWHFGDATVYGHFYTWGNGQRLITDGVWGNKLLHLVEAPSDGTWARKVICRTESSWETQQLHPHPRVSPDGQWVVFNSDRDGLGAIYMARLPGLHR